jgi:hypothetical protein
MPNAVPVERINREEAEVHRAPLEADVYALFVRKILNREASSNPCGSYRV